MFTGELTVAPFVGVQMVTDGLVVLRVHCACAPRVNVNIRRTTRKDQRETAVLMIRTQYFGQFWSNQFATPECLLVIAELSLNLSEFSVKGTITKPETE
jgi:hypothetical protein